MALCRIRLLFCPGRVGRRCERQSQSEIHKNSIMRHESLLGLDFDIPSFVMKNKQKENVIYKHLPEPVQFQPIDPSRPRQNEDLTYNVNLFRSERLIAWNPTGPVNDVSDGEIAEASLPRQQLPNTEYINVVRNVVLSSLNELVRLGRQAEAASLFETYSYYCPAIRFDSVIVCKMLITYCKMSLFLHSKQLFNDLAREAPQRLDNRIFSVIIEMYLYLSDFETSERLYSLMISMHIPPTIATFTVMLKYYVRNRMHDRVRDVLQRMQESQLERDGVFYYTLLCSCAEIGEFEEYDSLQSKLSNLEIEITPKARCRLANAFTIYKQTCRFKSLLKEMKAENIIPDADFYNTIIKACSRAGNVYGALKLYEEMKMLGIYPTVDTFSVLINMYARARVPPNECHLFIKQIWQEMLNLGVHPDCHVYGSILHAYRKSMNLQKFTETLNDMKDRNVAPNMIVYCEIYQFFAYNLKSFDTCEKIYQEIQSKKFWLDLPFYTVLFETHIVYDKSDKVPGIFQLMLDHYVVPDILAYVYLIIAYADLGMMSKAEDVFLQSLITPADMMKISIRALTKCATLPQKPGRLQYLQSAIEQLWKLKQGTA
ncbi:uncharacterized protein LOC126325800 [Schistocerca gregaria]|uniref:uncharacterized protein LOC126325800 n=1 Tax=Schistocerca gregaria TaxID=7010 RepID=UPI00211E5758|nr:uncharacterized protein LOC126325800 [Schistocerca gregaria]